MLNEEATNTNFILFGLTQAWLEPAIYHTPGEHANYYTNDAVVNNMNNAFKSLTVKLYNYIFLYNLFSKSILKPWQHDHTLCFKTYIVHEYT